jgi:hypothetical protein
MYSFTLSLTSALDGVGGQRHVPSLYPPGNEFVLIVQRPDGPLGRSKANYNNSITTKIEFSTVSTAFV